MSETREFFESEFSDNPHSNNSPEFLHPDTVFDMNNKYSLEEYLELAKMTKDQLAEILVIAGLSPHLTERILDGMYKTQLKFLPENGGIRNKLTEVIEALNMLGSVEEFKNQANVTETGTFSIQPPVNYHENDRQTFLRGSTFGLNAKKDATELYGEIDPKKLDFD